MPRVVGWVCCVVGSWVGVVGSPVGVVGSPVGVVGSPVGVVGSPVGDESPVGSSSSGRSVFLVFVGLGGGV